jgi:hypothetical protein
MTCEIDKVFQSQLKNQKNAFDKGYLEAMQQVNQLLKMKSQEMRRVLQMFEKIAKPKKVNKTKTVSMVTKAEEAQAA